MRIHREEGGLTFARIEMKTPVLRPAIQSKQSSLCGLHRSGDQIVSVKKAANKKSREAERSLMKSKKNRAIDASLRNTLAKKSDSNSFEKPRKHLSKQKY